MQDPVFLQKWNAYPMFVPCIPGSEVLNGLPNGGFGGKVVAVPGAGRTGYGSRMQALCRARFGRQLSTLTRKVLQYLEKWFCEKMCLPFVRFASQMAGVEVRKGNALERGLCLRLSDALKEREPSQPQFGFSIEV